MTPKHRSLKLDGIPHWVTSDDVRRMAERAKADGIVDGMFFHPKLAFPHKTALPVRLHSMDGLPTGKASIEFATAVQTKHAARLLENAQISAVPITVAGYEHGVHKPFSRQPRGMMTPFGTGMMQQANAPATAVIYGFPKKFSVTDVRMFLEDYRLDTWGIAREAFVPIMRCVSRCFLPRLMLTIWAGSSARQSRWAIHLDSLSDAHRLVRHIHMKRFSLGDGVETTLGARVLYSQDESSSRPVRA